MRFSGFKAPCTITLFVSIIINGKMIKMIKSVPIPRMDPEIKVSPRINPRRERDFEKKNNSEKNRRKLPLPNLISGVNRTNWKTKRITPMRFNARSMRSFKMVSNRKIENIALNTRIKSRPFISVNFPLTVQIVSDILP